MPPTLILVRHAQAEHNPTQDYSLHDPSLTELGREQCVELRKGLMEDPLAQQAELIITSPMRRTIQTALDTVDWLVEKGVKIQADALWQENSAKPCDIGTVVSKVAQEFPSIDYSTVDPVWPDKTSPAGSQYHYTKTAILARAQAALQKLYNRPEKVIIVVSHSGFLRAGVTSCWFFNADYRIFDFAAMDSPGSLYRLEQHASTRERGGGLGHSWTKEVPLGDGLPEELPKAEE
ncbi:putative phosphoglycerate mutase [Rosellinia necatrix]|uniref:Putative phosphoglycerate mutase n=1 Tax=Rosellinia necatrix TaxID=77044 RepID=A0A1S7UJ37_ROSNE|nr:putative phosphoglycerate mutase [Rosellinia necatrix]